MKKLTASVFLLCLLGLPCRLPAQEPTLEQAIVQTRNDIQTGLNSLDELRNRVNSERIPLARELEELEKKTARLRTQADHIRQTRLHGRQQREDLLAKKEELAEECRFILALFKEYRRSMPPRNSTAMSEHLRPQLEAIDNNLTADDSFGALTEGIAQLLTLSTASISNQIGGCAFEGTALDEKGIEQKGTFVEFGPVSYFISRTGTHGGIAVTQSGMNEPGIYSNPQLPDLASAIDAAAKGKEEMLPADMTAGDALKVMEASDTLISHAGKGGFVMIPLLLLGACALVLSLLKVLELSKTKVKVPQEATEEILSLIRNGQEKEAKDRAKKLPYPVSSLFLEAIHHFHASREHMEEIMHEHVMAFVPGLERHLGTLAVLGGIAPLLGLLGTVTGMIHTFQLVTVFGSGNAKLLSGGISEALVTTEFGLAIAIPVLLVHAFLTRYARSILGQLERTAISLVNRIQEGQGEK